MGTIFAVAASAGGEGELPWSTLVVNSHGWCQDWTHTKQGMATAEWHCCPVRIAMSKSESRTERRCCLVEDEYPPPSKDRPCHAYKLPLPDAQILAEISHHGVETSLPGDELLERGTLECFPQVVVASLAEGIEVATHSACEYHRLLAHHAAREMTENRTKKSRKTRAPGTPQGSESNTKRSNAADSEGGGHS